MSWAIIAQIIAQFGPAGIDLAHKLWQKWAAKGEPTQADWDELRALGSQTFRSQAVAALVRNGISVDDPRAVELLKLIQ